jgi:hypothetical protein
MDHAAMAVGLAVSGSGFVGLVLESERVLQQLQKTASEGFGYNFTIQHQLWMVMWYWSPFGVAF